jgi:hypothetical protein
VEAKEAVAMLEVDVQKLKDTAVTKEQVEGIVKASLPKFRGIESGTMHMKATTASNGGQTLVMGGFASTPMVAAVQWIDKVIKKASVASPQDIYKKGTPEEQFKGLLFMKFATIAEATAALTAVNETLLAENAGKPSKERLWCNFEQPIEKRACNGFLFALSRQLIEWKFPKECIEVNTEDGTMKIENKPVVTVTTDNYEIKIDWVMSSWEHWPELQSSKKFETIFNEAKDKLAKSKASVSKGIGKGPGGQ